MVLDVSKLRWPNLPRLGHVVLVASFVFFLPLRGAFAQQSTPDIDQVIIPNGTPVRLQLLQTISSAHAHCGERLDFEVVEDVIVGGATVIQAGTLARGYVVKVEGRRYLGIGGKLDIKVESVKLITGERIRLRGGWEFKGGNHTRLMATEMVVAGLIYLPAAPAFLLTHGHDCNVLKSTEVTAHIAANVPVQPSEVAKANESNSRLNEMLAHLPPRAQDVDGREGDMINLVFVGREDDVQRVFARAGWVSVDKINVALFWRLLREREHYTKLPMKTYYALGRPQDYAYSLPDPAAIVARRHHLRIWRTGYTVKGSPVWVGAATYDVAIEIEMRKFRIDHRIDPDVDAEREFIARSLTQTHLVNQVQYLSSPAPVFRARTASGEVYHSDSRILLVDFSTGSASTIPEIEAANNLSKSPPSALSESPTSARTFHQQVAVNIQ